MKKLHMIGNAHLDPVWLWDWREGFQENKATFKSALDRMEEYDEFVFTSSSAQFYSWIEENAPDMFQRIKKRIEEGRWIICGGWWVQPDCNIPSGESFARHALLAQNYFYEKFGVIANTGYNVDSFGHAGTLPQILKKSRLNNYVFMRPGPHEMEMPARAFLWESQDGSTVKAFRIPICYNVWKDMEEHVDLHIKEYSEGVDHMMLFYGVGNHGGGPTIENIKSIKELQEKRKDIEIVFSDVESYFKDIEGCDLPTVKGELQHHAPGCYSVESMIKMMNRRAENALTGAEIFSVMADKAGKKKDTANLNEAWQTLLFNQFHDILAGSSVSTAYYDARNQLGGCIATADAIENSARQAISFDINIPYADQSLPIVVFNPHGFEVTSPVEFETRMFRDDFLPNGIKILNSEGDRVEVQGINASNKTMFSRRYTFMATVPALGYALYTVVEGEPEAKNDNHDLVLENDILKVLFDETTGAVCKITDKRSGNVVLNKAATAAVIDDDTDTWGHTLTSLNNVAGEFKMSSYKVMDKGRVRSCVNVTSAFNDSTLNQRYRLYDGDDKLYVDCTVNWQENCRALKLYIPVNLPSEGTAIAQAPFGKVTKKQDGLEEPMQSFADISGDEFGLAVLNDGRYGVDFKDNTIGITVLRSSVYAHHDPYELKEGEFYEYIDKGISEFSYIIKPHNAGRSHCDVVKDSMVLNQPLRTMFETFHDGDMPKRCGNMSIDKNNIIMTALKKSYDSEKTILRVYECLGEETTATINLFNTEIKRRYKPYEIVTFAVDSNSNVTEVDLLEWVI